MPRKTILFLNVIVVLYLVLIIINLNIPISTEFMTYSIDSQEYFSTGTEFFDLHATGASVIRPFLYPLFVRIFHFIGGAYGVWIAQLLLWLAAANFILLAIYRWIGNKGFAIFGMLAFCSNLTLISYSYHILTEVSTAFLLAWMCYVAAKKEDVLKIQWFLKIVALLVALVLVKPLFLYPLFATLIFGAVYYFRTLIRQPKFAALSLLILLPVLLQYSVMKVKYNKWELSEISGITFRNYYVAQGYQKIEGFSRDSALAAVKDMSSGQMLDRIGSKLPEYLALFADNIEENIAARPSYLSLTKETQNMRMFCWQYSMNKKYFWITCLFGIIGAIVFFHQLKKKRLKEHIPLWISFGMVFYIIASSGISYWQAERLTIFALPMALFAICGLIIYMFPALTKTVSTID